MVPELGAMKTFLYDCGRFPDVCKNTQCFFAYYPSAPKGLMTMTYDNTVVNRRTLAMSGLRSNPSGDRDEVPMNNVRCPWMALLVVLTIFSYSVSKVAAVPAFNY